ncbi:MAG: DUF4432 family protein [Anaerolineae bacterium]|nr:DUF4432 family protein [Anaerolineae bacterium]
MKPSIIHLYPEQFNEKEKVLVESAPFRVCTFKYPSGVLAVRLQSDLGELVMLPFQGQQIWKASMLGRDLTMQTIFDQPYPTREFLSTFGGFMLHCGATAIGSPGPLDHHAVHGELPNAPYETAQIILGQDENGAYLGLTGTYRHQMNFNYNYIAQPTVKLYAGSSILHISMDITNQRATPLPFMYMSHINFRPVDNARLHYSAPCDPAHIKVRASVPGHMLVKPGYREFIERLRTHPEEHLVLKPELNFDPEVVFYLYYLADEAGWTYALHQHPDGSSDLVQQRLDQLNHGVCWISRMPDQQAIGLEPATAEVDGFTLEKEKGNLRLLEQNQVFHCDIKTGVLTAPETEKVLSKIEKLILHQNK